MNIEYCPFCNLSISDLDWPLRANHVRWCKENPKRNTYIDSGKEKAKLMYEAKVKKYGQAGWNKGLTKYTNDSVAKGAANLRGKKKKRDNEYFENRKIYKGACKFRFDVRKYCSDEDLALLKKYKMYSPGGGCKKPENLDGVSRDHLFSINDGLKNNIPPEIMRHPANCRLILHKDNMSKHKNSIITYDELINKIKNYKSAEFIIEQDEINKIRIIEITPTKKNKKLERRRHKLEVKKEAIDKIKNQLKSSNINFNKFGWVSKASEIIGIPTQHVNNWMKKYWPDFYINCFMKQPRLSING
jgi:hypothetical protein